MKLLPLLAIPVAALMLSGCATAPAVTTPQYEPKAAFSDFKDATWLPETTVRAPYNAREVTVNAAAALKEGLHVFYGTHDTRFALEGDAGIQTVTENAVREDENAVSWGAGADTVYRDGLAVANRSGGATAQTLEDGRILIRSAGDTNMFVAVALKAYNVSGLPVRQLLRDGNNRPAPHAWFVKKDTVFPEGSIAYLTTWWLGDDEVVTPAKTAFTGAKSFDELVKNFNGRRSFCLSYISHQAANPYGVVFQPVKLKRGQSITTGMSGDFRLSPVKKSVFCAKEDDAMKAITGESQGTWTVKSVRGTRVMELAPSADVAISDLGVQPVNSNAMTVGFAEIKTPAAAKKGSKKPAYNTRIMPVRILHANQPITDFRLRFNDKAAAAVRDALAAADMSKRHWEAENK